MSGTKAGGKKTAATNMKKYGSDFYVRIGAKGGRNGHTGGFAANPERARFAGRKGGRKSSRAGVKNGEGKYKRQKKAPEIVEDVREFKCYKVIEQPQKRGIFSRLFGAKHG